MTTIYLIRHAEAEGNRYRIWQGASEGQITEHGRRQLEALAKRFQDIPIDALYSSDRARAQETALALMDGHPDLKLNIDPRLQEINVGSWEQKPFANTAYYYPEQMEYFNHDPEQFEVDGAERFAEVRCRMEEVLSEIARKYPGQTVAVASHGMAIRTILSSYLKIPSQRISELPHGDNTSVSKLVFNEGDVTVEYCNDDSHLGEELATLKKQNWWKNRNGTDNSELRDEPLRFPEDSTLYSQCYRNAWIAAHGSDSGFVSSPYLTSAIEHVKQDREAIRKLYCEETFAGLLELDVNRGKESGYGWITLLYLEPEFRDRGMGIQLLGRAVLFFRERGRDRIQLHVSEDNKKARAFYQRNGFSMIGVKNGIRGDLLLMEKEI